LKKDEATNQSTSIYLFYTNKKHILSSTGYEKNLKKETISKLNNET